MAAGGLLFVAAFALAADNNPLMSIASGGFPTSDSLSYQFHDAPAHPEGSPINIEQHEDGQFIVSQTSTQTWTVRERFGEFNLSAPVVIPQTNLSIPTQLWSLEGGVGYARHLQAGRSWGASFTTGSDSDRLFYTINETVFQANVNYRLPSGDRNAWLFFLSYSNNRHFLNNIPLPGFGYFFDIPKDHLKGAVGFPFLTLLYTPLPRWSGSLSVFGPDRVNSEIDYVVAGPVRLYGGFDWGQLEWERANRDNNSNRLFFDRKRLMLGVRSPIPWGFSLDVSGGREFDRKFYENTSASTSGVPYASLPSAWYFETKVTLKFAGPASLEAHAN
jgi:hypothetical protein